MGDARVNNYRWWSGNDSVHARGLFNDSFLYGGKGNDVLKVIVGSGTVEGVTLQITSGNNTFEVTANTTVKTTSITGGIGNDGITVTSACRRPDISAGAANDTVQTTGALATRTIDLGAGIDTYTHTGGAISKTSCSGVSGTNTIDITGGTTEVTVTGGAGVDSLDLGATPARVLTPWALVTTPSISLVVAPQPATSSRWALVTTSVIIAGAVSKSTIYGGTGDDVLTTTNDATSESPRFRPVLVSTTSLLVVPLTRSLSMVVLVMTPSRLVQLVVLTTPCGQAWRWCQQS